ncbi:MAG: hypothetical protein GWO83_00720 [Bacteroidia bacterium]|nr:hypothetical protein [Bacteroidia bacterium]
MASDDRKTFGVEIRAGAEDTPSISLDADVRGFTGLLVGLAVGILSWGLIITLWWLV